jgi:1-acyl-sn-glycerol-3-phosphate acyltransferase
LTDAVTARGHAAGDDGELGAAPTHTTRRRLALPVRSLRAARTFAHVLRGLATTTFVFPFVSAARRRALTQQWSVRLLRVLCVECRVVGPLALRDGNLLLVANHVSWLDIFVLNALHPVRFVAKSDIARWPLAGRLVRGAGTLFIERARRRDTHRVNRIVADALAGGDVVAVFPEGTTSHGEGVLPFKSSLLQPIVDAAGHVQPLALRYRGIDGVHTTAPSYVGEDPFMASFWRVCGEARLVVDVVPLDPIDAAGQHRRTLARDAEAAIRRVLSRDVEAAVSPPASG